jgi:hypothetical protein
MLRPGENEVRISFLNDYHDDSAKPSWEACSCSHRIATVPGAHSTEGHDMLHKLKVTKLIGFISMGGLALVLASGCGGDDDSGNGGGSSEAFSQRCEQVCQLQTDGGCGLLETQDCIDICSAFAGVEASCAAAIEATMDCQIAGGTTTACDTTACQAEMDAQDSDCSS